MLSVQASQLHDLINNASGKHITIKAWQLGRLHPLKGGELRLQSSCMERGSQILSAKRPKLRGPRSSQTVAWPWWQPWFTFPIDADVLRYAVSTLPTVTWLPVCFPS